MKQNQPLPVHASGFLRIRRTRFRSSVRRFEYRFLFRRFRGFGFQYGGSSGRQVLERHALYPFWVFRWNIPGLDLARILECGLFVYVY
jgi:hypothetical protein